MQTHTGTMVDPAGRFGRLVDAMPDGIVLAELSGRIVYVNYVLGRMSGSSGEKLRGQPVEVIVPARVR